MFFWKLNNINHNGIELDVYSLGLMKGDPRRGIQCQIISLMN